MLSDAVVSLGYVALRPVLGRRATRLLAAQGHRLHLGGVKDLFRPRAHEYAPVPGQVSERDGELPPESRAIEDPDEQADAPPEQRISGKLVLGGLAVSILLCILTTSFVFGGLVPLHATVVAVAMALLLSIMGVRALGETDLNPVSGISKLAQLIFAFIVPQSNKSSVLVNLVAGAIVSPAPPLSFALRRRPAAKFRDCC